MDREYLIIYILEYSKIAVREDLEKMTTESLVIVKVQIELELEQIFYN